LPVNRALYERKIDSLALFSISIGLILLLIGVLLLSLAALLSGDDSNVGFGIMFSLFPIFIGVLLIVPSTFFRLFYLVKTKNKQSPKELTLLWSGVIITIIILLLVSDLLFI